MKLIDMPCIIYKVLNSNPIISDSINASTQPCHYQTWYVNIITWHRRLVSTIRIINFGKWHLYRLHKQCLLSATRIQALWRWRSKFFTKAKNNKIIEFGMDAHHARRPLSSTFVLSDALWHFVDFRTWNTNQFLFNIFTICSWHTFILRFCIFLFLFFFPERMLRRVFRISDASFKCCSLLCWSFSFVGHHCIL